MSARRAPGASPEVLVGMKPGHGRAEHSLHIYESDRHLIDSLVRFLGPGIRSGASAVVIATRDHLDQLVERLEREGLPPGPLRDEGRCLLLEARETLDSILSDGWPDERRFFDVVGGAIARAGRWMGPGGGNGAPGRSGGGRRNTGARERAVPRPVLAYGEMVSLLWAEGKVEETLRLEELWDRLQRTQRFALRCAYPLRDLGGAGQAGAFRRVCEAHSHVTPAESYTNLDEAGKLRVVAELQQKAAALEGEVRRRAQLESELHTRLQQLAESDRRKEEFLATLAHELRNPLAPIKLAAGLARARCGCAGSARHLDMIERQADHLSRLVEDLVDVSRITHGTVELRREHLAVDTLIARAVDSTRVLLEQRGHAIRISTPSEPLLVIGDPVRLEQVLVNLLANAAHYTPHGGSIGIEAVRRDARVELRVRDNGVGLEPEELGSLFDLFLRGTASRGKAPGGLGIGLTIARGLVELHGGTIEARSDGAGQGAEFVVHLPIADGVPASVARERSSPPLGSLRVLVVDDNADAGEALAELLRDEGQDVRQACDGPEALAVCAEYRPQLVLLDIGLPGMDGYEVARRLRIERPEVLLVAVTGYGQPRDHRRTAEVGFSGHLVKPVHTEALLRTLASVYAAVGHGAPQPARGGAPPG